MQKSVVIDCFPSSAQAYRNDHVIVAIDVIRATTTAVTAVACGRKCFPIASLEEVALLAAQLTNPLLVGEIDGQMPPGFDLNNSPTDVEAMSGVSHPIILLSTNGTKLIREAWGAEAVYISCLRNYQAQASYLIAHHPKVAIIGAGSRNEFREEDQLCCAWIADLLVAAGYEPQNATTAALIKRWRGMPVTTIKDSTSCVYLSNSGQERDLEFILAHLNDLKDVYKLENGKEIIKLHSEAHALTQTLRGSTDSCRAICHRGRASSSRSA